MIKANVHQEANNLSNTLSETIDQDKEEERLRRFIEFEGLIRHMYLDSLGNVTTGVGHLLKDAAAACTLPFFHKNAPERPAELMEISVEFGRIHDSEAGHAANYYDRLATLYLKEDDICDILNNDLCYTESGLREGFSNYGVEFDAMPYDVQSALLDMAFNLGTAGLFKKFPKFIAAIVATQNDPRHAADHYREAAAESHRLYIQESRNEYVKNILLKAAEDCLKLGEGVNLPLSP